MGEVERDMWSLSFGFQSRAGQDISTMDILHLNMGYTTKYESSVQGRSLSLLEVDMVARIVNSNTYDRTKEGIHLLLGPLK